MDSRSLLFPVNDIYPCIQGEGVNTGLPMVMLRLQWCGIGCPWCDTKETWELKEQVTTIEEALGKSPKFCWLTADEIASYISSRRSKIAWVLISGGEPAMYKLNVLAGRFHAGGFKVAVETSGTLEGHVEAGLDWITVSPKLDMPGGYKVRKRAVLAASEVKFVVGREADLEKLQALIRDGFINPGTPICLQPVSQSAKATQLCIEECFQTGWRLSVQAHKYIGLP